jgi:hypothetical protein
VCQGVTQSPKYPTTFGRLYTSLRTMLRLRENASSHREERISLYRSSSVVFASLPLFPSETSLLRDYCLGHTFDLWFHQTASAFPITISKRDLRGMINASEDPLEPRIASMRAHACERIMLFISLRWYSTLRLAQLPDVFSRIVHNDWEIVISRID